MRIGALFPQFEIGADPSSVRDFAQAADELGYTHLTSFDQIIGLDKHSRRDWKYVHDAEDMFHEILVLFGYLAAVTERIELTTGILVLPMRGTALVAKQAAEIDVLSRGRLRLGVGVGVKPEEFEACGFEFKNRGKRVDEQIEVLRLLWTNDLIDFEGAYHRIERGGINPLPVQRPIPIWVGGISNAAIRRVARLGDGWLPNFEADEFGRASIQRMRTLAREYGRDAESIGIEATITIIDRTSEQLYEEIKRWEKIGATHVTLNTMPERWVPEEGRWNKVKLDGLSTPQDHVNAIRRFHDSFPELF